MQQNDSLVRGYGFPNLACSSGHGYRTAQCGLRAGPRPRTNRSARARGPPPTRPTRCGGTTGTSRPSCTIWTRRRCGPRIKFGTPAATLHSSNNANLLSQNNVFRGPLQYESIMVGLFSVYLGYSNLNGTATEASIATAEKVQRCFASETNLRCCRQNPNSLSVVILLTASGTRRSTEQSERGCLAVVADRLGASGQCT